MLVMRSEAARALRRQLMQCYSDAALMLDGHGRLAFADTTHFGAWLDIAIIHLRRFAFRDRSSSPPPPAEIQS